MKKIPPIPVTFFVGICSFVFVVTVLNANPKKNVVVHARVIKILFFTGAVLVQLFKNKKCPLSYDRLVRMIALSLRVRFNE